MRFLLSLSTVVSLALLGCGGSSGSSSAGLSGVIKIGAPIDMSGPAAFVGKDSQRGMQQAIDEINASKLLGGATLQLVTRDHRSDKNEATNQVRDLITVEQVNAIVGLNVSQIALAVGPIAGQEKVPMVTDTVVLPAFAALNDYTFLAAVPFINQIDPWIKSYGKAHWKSAVVFRNVDIDAELPQTKQYNDSFAAAGIKAFPEETNNSKTVDFSAQLTKVKAENPDVIVLQDLAQISAQVIRQARTLGIKADFTGTAALQSVDLINIAGAAAEGVTFPSPWDPSLDTPTNKKFVADYRAKYNADPGIWVSEAYTAIKLVAQAIANAKSTKRQAIRDALAKIKGMDSPYGSLTITNRVPSTPGVKMTIQGGKFVYQGKLP